MRRLAPEAVSAHTNKAATTGTRVRSGTQAGSCLGDFQKVWDRACEAIGMAGRTPHDLRRSGVKHYIDAGVDPHTVMKWSGTTAGDRIGLHRGRAWLS